MADNIFKDLYEDSPLSISEKLSRRRSDIELPTPKGGKTDPKLKRPDVMEGLRRAGEGYNKAKEVFGRKR